MTPHSALPSVTEAHSLAARKYKTYVKSRRSEAASLISLAPLLSWVLDGTFNLSLRF